jgi:hypothetical protein
VAVDLVLRANTISTKTRFYLLDVLEAFGDVFPAEDTS